MIFHSMTQLLNMSNGFLSVEEIQTPFGDIFWKEDGTFFI